MLPEKCSPKNAPLNKMLSIKILPKKCSPGKNAPRKKMLSVKMLSIKMLPEKNAPPKKCSPEKFSGFTYHRQSQRYVNPENSFKSVDEGRLG